MAFDAVCVEVVRFVVDRDEGLEFLLSGKSDDDSIARVFPDWSVGDEGEGFFYQFPLIGFG